MTTETIHALPLYKVWVLKFLTGKWRTKSLNDYIHKSFQATYYNIVLDPFRAAFIKDADVVRYYHENMPYRWTLVYKLGKIDLGSCTLSQALARVQQHMPKSIVRHVDDAIHTVVIKTIAEGKDE